MAMGSRSRLTPVERAGGFGKWRQLSVRGLSRKGNSSQGEGDAEGFVSREGDAEASRGESNEGGGLFHKGRHHHSHANGGRRDLWNVVAVLAGQDGSG